MVFESLVTEILNRILGDYIENLDSNQLSIGIWGGDVVLQDLVLKRTALDKLSLPIQTVYGRLGKLVLKIPWHNLYGAPVEAAIEKLYLLVIPSKEIKYDAEKEEQYEQEVKQAELERIEAAKKQEEEQGTSSDDTFVEKVTTQVIKNVQVHIQDIHIRYEDTVTNPKHPFAFGITLSNLSVDTTNEQWQPGITSSSVSKIYKMLDLNAFAVYWNCSCPLYSSMPVSDILKNFQDGIATRTQKPEGYFYMLGPINSSAKLRLNPKPENDPFPFSIPKMLLNLDMEKLAIGISKKQYYDIMLLGESMGRMKRGLPYRKYRPFVPTYRGYYKQWWQFAFTCVLQEQVRRRHRNWDWNHISYHRALCRDYADAYQTKLLEKKISEDVKRRIEEGERQLDVFNLVLIRQRIELEVARLEKKSEKKQSNWLGGWFGGASTTEDSSTVDIMKKFEEAMTPEEKAKLYRAIDYQENAAPPQYPSTFVANSYTFVLESLEVKVRDDDLNDPLVLSVHLLGVNCMVQERPASSALKVTLKINEFIVLGSRQGKIVPQCVSSENLLEDKILLFVLFETNPLQSSCNHRLHVRTHPLKVIYDAQTVIKVAEVFKTPKSIALQELQAAATSKLPDFKEMSATGMQYVIEQHVTMDVNINLFAPYIIVPSGGFYHTGKSFLVVNLGHVNIKSIVRDSSQLNIRQMHQRGTSEMDILKEVMSQSYDKFFCQLTDLQILIANLGEDWRECIVKNKTTQMHLLRPMTLILQINKCLVADDPRLPNIKLTGCLPSIYLNVTDQRILNLMSLISSIPFPGDDTAEDSPIAELESSDSSLVVPDYQKTDILTGFSSEKTTVVQLTLLDIQFEVTELILTISRQHPNLRNPPEKVLRFECDSLELEMVQQTFNMKVLVRLGRIELTQFRLNKQIQIVNTPLVTQEFGYLFTVQYTNVDKKSPELHTKYFSCENRLQLIFTTLHIQLHQEALQYIMEFSNEFQMCLSKTTYPSTSVEPRRTVVSISAGPNLPRTESSPRKSIKTKSSKPKPEIENVSFKLSVQMLHLNILISNDAEKLSSFEIRGVKSDVIVKKSYTHIVARLTNLEIIDENPLCIHRKILYKTGSNDALSTQVIMYSKENLEDQNMNDMSVTLTTDCLRITFLNYFVNKLLDFLNKFQAAQQAIVDASAAAAETAKQNLQNAFENAMRIELKIKIKAPVIIIPRNSKSLDTFMLDLGNLSLFNRFTETDPVDEYGNTALVDDIKMYLHDMKLSRVTLCEKLTNKYECLLLKPLTFNLRVKRNLSTSWYTKIPDLDVTSELKSVELKMSKADYNKMMEVLSENLGEQQYSTATSKSSSQIPDTEPAPKLERRKTTQSLHKSSSKRSTVVNEETHCFMRFQFNMEKLVVDLFSANLSKLPEDSCLLHSPTNGLARFTMAKLSLKGRYLTSGRILTSIKLHDCLLDDTRPGCESHLIRVLGRKRDLDEQLLAEESNKSMIDITYQQINADMFADVRIFSFNFIVSMDYLWKVLGFFSAPETQTPAKTQVKESQNQKRESTSSAVSDEPDLSSLTVNLGFQRPDIIFIERKDSINASALLLNNELMLHIRYFGTNQSIQACLTNLQLHKCCYNPERRNETMVTILYPCDINIIGSTPRGQGLHLDIQISDINMYATPSLIDFILRVYYATYEVDSPSFVSDNHVVDYSNIWEPSLFSTKDFWFLKTDLDARDILNNETTEPANEIVVAYSEFCHVSIDSFLFNIMTGGSKTVPMFLVEIGLETKVRNWSSKMNIQCSLPIQMVYYNNRLAIWEPFIELVELAKHGQPIYKPWTLQVEMKYYPEPQENMPDKIPEAGTIEEIRYAPPSTSIHVLSDVNLELVLTKTGVEVIRNFLDAYYNIAKEESIGQEEISKPYKIVNDSGLQITLLLENGDFQLCNQRKTSDFRDFILESGLEVYLKVKSKQEFDLATYMREKTSSGSLLHKVDETELVIIVAHSILRIPVVRADKRYFSLNRRGKSKDVWALVSDVTVNGTERVVTIRSILQVHNHFDVPVSVYYLKNNENVVDKVKPVQPGECLNLPMHAVYTLANELFFSVPGHCLTSDPYKWKDIQANNPMVKTVTCPLSKLKTNQEFVINVCGETDPIYYENTNRHTMISNCYNIHLRPAITFKNLLPVPVTCIIEENTEEYVVQPGKQINLCSAIPGSSYVIFRLDNYLEKLWSCLYNVLKDIPEFSICQFDSHDSFEKMSFNIGMHCLKKNHTQVISLYSPYWMLNKTGLMLSYRSSDKKRDVLFHPEYYKGPILFSFSTKNFFRNAKISVRLIGGEWCDSFSLNVTGLSGVVTCCVDAKMYHIGVEIVLTDNGLTKQVFFTPFYVLINNGSHAIEVQEYNRPKDPWVFLESGSCIPLWPNTNTEDLMLVLRVHRTSQISAPFLITESHSILLKLKNKYGGIHASIQVNPAAVYINFNEYRPGLAPVLIFNATNITLSFWEKDGNEIKKLQPCYKMLYTWENSTGMRQLIWHDGWKNEIVNELEEDGSGNFMVKPDIKIYWVSFLDDVQRVLLFTHDERVTKYIQSTSDSEKNVQEMVFSIHGICISFIDNYIRKEIMYIAMVGSGIIWEVRKFCSKRYDQLSAKDSAVLEEAYQNYLQNPYKNDHIVVINDHFEIDFLNKIMFKPHIRKIRRVFETGVWCQMKSSTNYSYMYAKINRLQIDNQMYNCIFPVVFSPVIPGKSVASDSIIKPFIELNIIKWFNQYSTLQQYKCFKLLVQEFHIRVDLGFVSAASEFYQTKELTDDDEAELFLSHVFSCEEPLKSRVYTQSLQTQKQFYEHLHFSKLKIHITFSLASNSTGESTPSGDASTSSSSVISTLLYQSLGVTLTEMQDVIFRLGYFERNNTFMDQNDLYAQVINHYTTQAIQQLYVLLLGLDVIGNPYGLIRGLSKGVEDMVYEPIKGAVQGPGEFAEGLFLGVRSFLGHTVGETAGTISRITGAMASSVAALSFDKEYQRNRRDQMTRKPENIAERFILDGKELLSELFNGLTGVIVKPVVGAKDQGFQGFLEGLGKGVVGLFTRPTVGVIDFASGSMHSVKRVAEIEIEPTRLRPARYIREDGLVYQYVKDEAEGNRIMMEMEKGRYANSDVYRFHVWVFEDKSVLLLTDKRLAYVIYKSVFKNWQVEWSTTWQEMREPAQVVPHGIQINIGESHKKTLGLFKSESNEKLVILYNPHLCEIIKNKIEYMRNQVLL